MGSAKDRDAPTAAKRHDSLLAKVERLLAPSYGYCYRCQRPWNRVEHHDTAYSESSACFPLCVTCWALLTPEERLPYYDELVDEWVRQARTHSEAREYLAQRGLIREAVLNGK